MFWDMMDNWMTALKYELGLASVVRDPTGIRGGFAAMFEETENVGEFDDDGFTVRMPCAAPTSSGGFSPGTAIGNGTEQQESTMMLGRPVMIPKTLSSEYRLHHVCTSISRFDALAEGSF
jgi:hypothetical protein